MDFSTWLIEELKKRNWSASDLANAGGVTRSHTELDDPLFATDSNRHLDRNNLGNMLDRLANRAGVLDVYPHRFRHTFAINYLRNRGDIYTLQKILGHNTLEMCLRYLRIAQTDLQDSHRRACH